MRITSLLFDPAPRTPTLRDVGIVLAVTVDPARKAHLHFEVTCRVAPANLPDSKLTAPAGMFLTAVHLLSQRPVLLNLVEERVLFDDDAALSAGYVVVVARGELDTSDGPIGPFLLHASCFQFVSNVIHVA
jgi:hypothetical protein